MTNIAIFVSGNGTNCENIIRYFKGSADASVRLVISNKADAYALARAARLGVPTMVMSRDEINDEQTMMSLLRNNHIGFIVLAGFMMIVPAFMVKSYARRIVNIHPSLLPKYGGRGMYGRHVHEAVKAAGETVSGITIHYVSDTVDGGEIIAQFSTPISPDDSAADIERKVRSLEMAHFPEVIGSVIRGIGKGEQW